MSRHSKPLIAEWLCLSFEAPWLLLFDCPLLPSGALRFGAGATWLRETIRNAALNDFQLVLRMLTNYILGLMIAPKPVRSVKKKYSARFTYRFT